VETQEQAKIGIYKVLVGITTQGGACGIDLVTTLGNEKKWLCRLTASSRYCYSLSSHYKKDESTVSPVRQALSSLLKRGEAGSRKEGRLATIPAAQESLRDDGEQTREEGRKKPTNF
jgi:hypothetical protein